MLVMSGKMHGAVTSDFGDLQNIARALNVEMGIMIFYKATQASPDVCQLNVYITKTNKSPLCLP